jgi:hypothetical protein
VAFHRADVTAMPFLIEPFEFVLDIGCLHSVPRRRRGDYAAEVSRLSRPGACYMLYAFLPAEKHPERGVSLRDVRELFGPAFQLERQEGGDDPNGPQAVWYWMRRHESGSSSEGGWHWPATLS